jgi:hypothetical protein
MVYHTTNTTKKQTKQTNKPNNKQHQPTTPGLQPPLPLYRHPIVVIVDTNNTDK